MATTRRSRVLLALTTATALTLVAAPLAAQHAGHHQPATPAAAVSHGEDHESSGWKELDAFHEVMAAAWHPAKMDSLAPARATAPLLVAAAKAWVASSAPAGCTAAPLRAAIMRLVPESEAVAALAARRADDATVKAALKTVHDTFHIVEDGCTPAKPPAR